MTLNGLGVAVLRYVLALVALALVWQLVISLGKLPPFLLPAPLKVLETLIEERSVFLNGAIYTVTNAAIGGLIGIVAGLGTGIALVLFPRLRWIAEPYVVLFQSFPRESLIPLFVVWMGFGASPKILSAAVLSYFPMTVLTTTGLLDTRREYVELIRSWGSSPLQELLFCRLPACTTGLIGAAGRVCLPLSLLGAALGEMTGGGSRGLGYIIVTSGSVSRVDRIFGSVVVLGVIGTLLLGFVTVVQSSLRRFDQE